MNYSTAHQMQLACNLGQDVCMMLKHLSQVEAVVGMRK